MLDILHVMGLVLSLEPRFLMSLRHQALPCEIVESAVLYLVAFMGQELACKCELYYRGDCKNDNETSNE